MSTPKILIVEDNLLHAEKAIFILDKLGYPQTQHAETLSKARQLVKSFFPDLILLDIQLNEEISGIELAEEIKTEQNIPIIFLTSLEEKFVFERAGQTQPDAILYKPLKEDNLKNTIQLALLKSAQSQNPKAEKAEQVETPKTVFVKVGNSLKKITLADIVYVAVSYKNYCDIHTLEKSYAVKTSLSELEQTLNFYKLIRVHRTALVNLDFVEEINEKELTLKTPLASLEIGGSYKKELQERIMRV